MGKRSMSLAPKNWTTLHQREERLLKDADGVIREQGQARVCTTCGSTYYIPWPGPAIQHGVARRDLEITECGSCYYR